MAPSSSGVAPPRSGVPQRTQAAARTLPRPPTAATQPRPQTTLATYRGSAAELETQCKKTSSKVTDARDEYRSALYRAVPRLKRLEEELKIAQREIAAAHRQDEALKRSATGVKVAERESAAFLGKMNHSYEDAVVDIQASGALSGEEKLRACRQAEECYMSIMSHHEDVQNFQRLVRAARSGNHKQITQ